LVGKRDSINGTLELLFVGRVVREKGVEELLCAVKKILTRRKGVKLRIVGDGPDLQDFIKRYKDLLGDAVEFSGFLTGVELEDVYRKADVLVFPTYHEGFPYVAIEAMRAGLPILSTGVGALDMLVKDGVTGFKVRPRDVDSIVAVINKIYIERYLLKEMSSNCLEYFRKYMSRSAAEIFYARLLSADQENVL
jgi:glycosyltransferase involved in cell wall biosynthesis